MSVLSGTICSLRWYIYLRSCLMRLVSVCYCVYQILTICGVCYVRHKRLYVLRVFDPGRLLGVRVGNLNELTKSKGCSTQAAYLG